MTPLRRITDLSTLDQLIVGVLILFLFVFGFELFLVVPCGGWENLGSCTGSFAEAARAAWQGYYEIDPYWGAMPDWYANIMNAQDYVYNPFWALSLVMFLSHKQETPWFRTAMIVVSAATMTTTLLVFVTQFVHPEITPFMRVALLQVNGPWVLCPLLFIVRMHGANTRATLGAGRQDAI
ncbi:MAG: DUF2781 domain-containing protein [bacterium]|nr:hypothetical protein [Deltaproteobacteria bacterium]MCP4903959.1 DUF2781 domain-containing protein [bacterium]